MGGVSAAPTYAPGQLRRAIVLMTASTVLFGFMAVCIRLASKQLHAFEIAFFRNLFGFVFTLPLLAKHGPGLLRTHKLGLYFFRCCIGVVSMLSGFWAIAHLPLAQAIAISYSTPIFVTIGAVFFLGEVVRARRWAAVIVGFIGVIVLMRGQKLGSRLLQQLAADARAAGIESLVLAVLADNAAARRLYEACGFTLYGTEPRAIRKPAGYTDQALYALDLR